MQFITAKTTRSDAVNAEPGIWTGGLTPLTLG
jgi:hypothetical protein